MGLKLKSTNGTGSVELNAPANHNIDTSFTLPTSNFTGGEWVLADGNGDVNIDNGTLYVDAVNDRVGVGTNAPGQLLEVENSSGNAAINITSSDSGYAELYLGDQSDATAAALSYEHSSNKLRIYNGGSIRATIDSSGNVGIGEISPDEPLHITASDPAIKLQDSDGTDQYSIIKNAGGDSVYDAVNGTGTAGAHIFRSPTGSANERLRIDTAGRLLVGHSSGSNLGSPSAVESMNGDGNNIVGARYSATSAGGPDMWLGKSRSSTIGTLSLCQQDDVLGNYGWYGAKDGGWRYAGVIRMRVDAGFDNSDSYCPGYMQFYTSPGGGTAPQERMRISSTGNVTVGKTVTTASTAGIGLEAAGAVTATRSNDISFLANRLNSDGDLFHFYQDTNLEGTISVSGSTVSYNGAHLSRWSQLPGGAEREEILRGTVLSNIDEMCDWDEEENEQLNRMKVSDVEGDPNVSGVFQSWDDDDDTYTDDFYCAMTGDFIIRIAQGVTVERGDLLMSAGDGTAKPQDDDIIRSKTIAKVTSTNVSCTYDDGSYCVPCVLMAC